MKPKNEKKMLWKYRPPIEALAMYAMFGWNAATAVWGFRHGTVKYAVISTVFAVLCFGVGLWVGLKKEEQDE